MDTSEKGLALIKSFEGCYLEAYLCPAKVWTIGYGHTDNVEKGQAITKEEAERLLIKDLGWAEDVIERHVKKPILDTLTRTQFDALVSFVFNVGEGAFRGSTLLKELNKGRFEAVPAQLLRWNKAGKPKKTLKGLTRRRHAEAALWNAIPVPVNDNEPHEPMPQAVCPSTPPMAALAQSKTIWGTGLGGIAAAGKWILDGTAEASKQTAESLSATSALRDALGMSSGSLLTLIALVCVGVAFSARLSAHFGGKIG